MILGEALLSIEEEQQRLRQRRQLQFPQLSPAPDEKAGPAEEYAVPGRDAGEAVQLAVRRPAATTGTVHVYRP
ncbi:hypothetical protein JTE90_006144 [Oedothorax gibbosus]|uniref:Uncharacterized protein n=1 Tax=Oedothorax gibbosus TaxID=931172 RepID=A0AAV6TX26_9ARAC|nr:hypothetical protein JTE90_006144 [Oedothorax gibbosus]